MASETKVWTPLALIAWTKDHFAKKGIESPRLAAEVLLAHAIGCKRIDLYARFETPVAPAALDAYRETVRRHAAHEPLQYILGFAEFRGLKLEVGPGVFIPRPETEELVEAALARCREFPAGPVRVLDLGTGSGCIPVALSVEEPRVQVVATDASETALKFAAENLAENGVPVFGEEARQAASAAAKPKAPRKKKKSKEGQAAEPAAAEGAGESPAPAEAPPAEAAAPGGVKLLRGDLFEALAGEDRQPYHMVISNPPYIPREATHELPPGVVQHEPHEALFAADSGFAVIEEIMREAPAFLLPGGWLLVEIGEDHGERARGTLAGNPAYEAIEVLRDLSGHDRIAVARRGKG